MLIMCLLRSGGQLKDYCSDEKKEEKEKHGAGGREAFMNGENVKFANNESPLLKTLEGIITATKR